MWFEMKPRDLKWLEGCSSRLVVEVELGAAPEAIFAVLADIDQWPLWFAEIQRATWETQPPHGAGSQRTVVLDTMSLLETFLAWVPGERLSFTMNRTTLPLATSIVEDYRLSPAGAGRTHLAWVIAYELRWYVRPFAPLARWVFGRMFRRAGAALVRHVAAHP